MIVETDPNIETAPAQNSWHRFNCKMRCHRRKWAKDDPADSGDPRDPKIH
jgi:hypothetical protein